jgi:hypothetical protein
MNRSVILLLAAGIAGIAVFAFASGQGGAFFSSMVHGVGWGIGREVAHGLFR